MSYTNDEFVSGVRVRFLGGYISSDEHTAGVDAVYAYARHHDLDLQKIATHEPHVIEAGANCAECNYFRSLQHHGLFAAHKNHAVIPSTMYLVLDLIQDDDDDDDDDAPPTDPAVDPLA
jgi:hypothetical protein